MTDRSSKYRNVDGAREKRKTQKRKKDFFKRNEIYFTNNGKDVKKMMDTKDEN